MIRYMDQETRRGTVTGRLRRRRAARLPGERRREHIRRMILRATEELIPVPDPVSMAEIARIEELARAAGMSYGRYVAAHPTQKAGKRAVK